jgi:hypothetical protein
LLADGPELRLGSNGRVGDAVLAYDLGLGRGVSGVRSKGLNMEGSVEQFRSDGKPALEY